MLSWNASSWQRYFRPRDGWGLPIIEAACLLPHGLSWDRSSAHFEQAVTSKQGLELILSIMDKNQWIFFPKLTKNKKVGSVTCYLDQQKLSQSQGNPLPIFHFPRHRTSPSPNSGTTWSFVQVCVTQVRVPRKLWPPSSMPPSLPLLHPKSPHPSCTWCENYKNGVSSLYEFY